MASVRPAAVGELEAHGTQGSAWLTFPKSESATFSLCLFPLWMNPERANTAVITAKKRDGARAFVHTAFLKVVTFVGTYGVEGSAPRLRYPI